MINDYEATKPITTDATYDSTKIDNDDVISTLNGLIPPLIPANKVCPVWIG